MSSGNQPLSRRALLKSAAIAPVILIGNRVAAGEMSYEDACKCLEEGSTCPESDLLKVLELAEEHWVEGMGKDEKDFPCDRYKLIVLALWTYFGFGTETTEIPERMLVKAFHYGGKRSDAKGTGKLILERLDWFDPCGHHATMNTCAYMCGHEASTAWYGKKNSFDEKDFEKAWDKVEKNTKDRVARIETTRVIDKNNRARGMGPGC